MLKGINIQFDFTFFYWHGIIINEMQGIIFLCLNDQEWFYSECWALLIYHFKFSTPVLLYVSVYIFMSCVKWLSICHSLVHCCTSSIVVISWQMHCLLMQDYNYACFFTESSFLTDKDVSLVDDGFTLGVSALCFDAFGYYFYHNISFNA